MTARLPAILMEKRLDPLNSHLQRLSEPKRPHVRAKQGAKNKRYVVVPPRKYNLAEMHAAWV